MRARRDAARARQRQTRLGRGNATRGGPRASRGADAHGAAWLRRGRRRGRRGRTDPGGERGTHGGRAGEMATRGADAFVFEKKTKDDDDDALFFFISESTLA